ncbi:unnamed protein product [Calypogeia fissa]
MASDEAAVVTHAQQLLDFDWKLKYVVSSASLASVNRPLLRLEMAVTAPTVNVESVPYFRRESVEEKPQIAVAEYSKTELEKLISEMEAISQALESNESSD